MTENKTLSQEDFVKSYAKKSKMTVEECLRLLMPMPCDCGDESCDGWQMLSRPKKEKP